MAVRSLLLEHPTKLACLVAEVLVDSSLEPAILASDLAFGIEAQAVELSCLEDKQQVMERVFSTLRQALQSHIFG